MAQTSPEAPPPIAASVILQQLHDTAPRGPVTLRWLIDGTQRQSFGLLLVLLAIAAAVPGICTFAALVIVIAAFQMLIGYGAPRLPRWIADRPLPRRRLAGAVPPAIRLLRAFERVLRPRGAAPAVVATRLAAAVMLLLGLRILLMPAPLSNVLPALLATLIALALLEADRLWLVLTIIAGLIFLAIDVALVSDFIHGGVRT